MKAYKVVVQPEAEQEIEAIWTYQYELAPERAQRFIDAFEACIEQLRRAPLYQKRKGLYRHVRLGRLPYRVVFEVEDSTVFIYQVRHTSRVPSKRFGP